MPIVLFFKKYFLVLGALWLLLQTLLWSRMTCSSKIFQKPFPVLADTPASYILIFWLRCIFNSFHCCSLLPVQKKRSWNWTLPWIKAHIELSNTIVYDYKMSTGSSSARNSHLAQWERTTMKPYLRTDLFIGEQSIIIKKTTTQQLKEGVTTIFTVVYLYLDSIFLWSFHFALSYNSFHRHEHHCRSFPLEKVRIPRGTAARAHFVVINKGARRFYLNSATR